MPTVLRRSDITVWKVAEISPVGEGTGFTASEIQIDRETNPLRVCSLLFLYGLLILILVGASWSIAVCVLVKNIGSTGVLKDRPG